MLTLDQVKLLEAKVESLIEMVGTLYAERDALKETVKNKERLIADLSQRVAGYEMEQAKIEERVISALNQLDMFQSSVSNARAILSEKKEDDMSASQASTTNEVQESIEEKLYVSDNNVSNIKNSNSEEFDVQANIVQNEIPKNASSEHSGESVQTFTEESSQQNNTQKDQKSELLSDKIEDDNSDKQMDIF